ncbi:hypothetical protein OG921_24240 [Aldersonia sp. NBC_00410]|uniref:hypothetical protein n=1 Tax=Aldersonia sp. NBC_00410 TaxID=2975954 RepID=UPI00225939F6|nr:hypothetical protein [Aldersonia sp. NBC_00410]MCX5046286.1 hypothetical protein [Aldersonia sp. NBC_00410]
MSYNTDHDDTELAHDGDGPEPQLYAVFNVDRSVGVWCDRSGETVHVQLTADALHFGERWLASEIVMVAGLAHEQARVALGEEILEAGRARGEMGLAHAREVVREMGLPSDSEYRRMVETTLYGPV